MMKFTYQFNEDHPKVEITLSPETGLPETLEAFESFLRAAGYSFQGIIDIVDDEAPWSISDESIN